MFFEGVKRKTASVTESPVKPVSNFSLLTVVLKVIALFLILIDVILLLPLNFQGIAFVRNNGYLISYLVPILSFVLLLLLGLKNLLAGKCTLRQSFLSLIIVLFGVYFLAYLPFLGRNVFSYLYLEPLMYIAAPLAYFLIEAVVSKISFKKGLLVAGIAAGLAAFLITNSTLRAFYNNSLKVKVSQIPTLSLSDSWNIGMETLKQKPMFGIGAGNYEYAFTQYKPAAFNLSTNWLLRFGSAGNLFFQVVTLGGVIGLLLMVGLFLAAVKMFPFKKNPVLGGFYVTALLLVYLAIPFSLPLVFFLFFLLALGSAFSEGKETVISTKAVVYGCSALSIILSAAGGFFFIKATAGDYHFQKAQVAQAANDGIGTYNGLIAAIKVNPQSDVYHRVYAQINLLLANSLSNQQNLTDTDKTQIQTLLEQSIREARIITEQTNPTSSVNWELRGQIYRNLIGVVQNADQWSADAFSQAINLDPMNPLLKIDLGGIYYQAKNYNDAQTLFQDAVRVKPDYANAYYNLAHTLKDHGDLTDAITRLNQAISLIDKSSADYTTANTELEAWKKEAGIDTTTNQNGTTTDNTQETTTSANP